MKVLFLETVRSAEIFSFFFLEFWRWQLAWLEGWNPSRDIKCTDRQKTNNDNADKLTNNLLFTWREASTRKIDILEGGTTFRWVCIQKFQSVWLTVEEELKIKDYPLNDPPPVLCVLSLIPGSSWRMQLHSARIFPMLGSSYLSAREIVVLGRP